MSPIDTGGGLQPIDMPSMPTQPTTQPPVHPLSGADLPTLLAAAWRGGGVECGRRLAYAVCLGAALGRLPFTVAENLVVAAGQGSQGINPPPLFILGHWRSGTTHLYNILGKSPRFGYLDPLVTGLPWEARSLVRWLRPLLERALPEHRWIDNIPVNRNSPQEDEIALANMSTLSFYHGIYFPKMLRRQFPRGNGPLFTFTGSFSGSFPGVASSLRTRSTPHGSRT